MTQPDLYEVVYRCYTCKRTTAKSEAVPGYELPFALRRGREDQRWRGTCSAHPDNTNYLWNIEKLEPKAIDNDNGRHP